MVRISQTNLSLHNTCPHAFWLSLKWRPIVPISHAVVEGNNVHAVLAGEAEPMNERCRVLARELEEMREGLKIEIERKEFKQEFEVSGFTCVRVVDVLGRLPWGERVIIDYKTSTKPWVQINGSVFAQALSWQSVLYLWPTEEGWPTLMFYLIAPSRQIIAVRRDITREEELRRKLELIRWEQENGHIRHIGWNCNSCQYAPVCFEVPGWRASFEEVGHV